MLLFCPLCGGLLVITPNSSSNTQSGGGDSCFSCRSCAYIFPLEAGAAYASRVELKRKVVDDVLGGEDAWKNVDSTDGKSEHIKEFLIYFSLFSLFPRIQPISHLSLAHSTSATCPKCENNRAYFMQIQIRSADEPSSIFYKCCKHECGHQWREG